LHATAGELQKPLISGIETLSARSLQRKQLRRASATREMLSNHIFANRRAAIPWRANANRAVEMADQDDADKKSGKRALPESASRRVATAMAEIQGARIRLGPK
jgi:hypothetical protein